jgi:acetyltransferase-like isoleucine patch superfamily enzyme
MGLRKVLAYHKSIMKRSIKQWFYNNKLRFKIQIGKSCVISKDFKYGANVRIMNGVSIGTDVEIDNNVIIGNNASLSKVKIGDSTHIETGVKITGNGQGRITIGKQSYIGINNVLDWSDNITIGDYVHIAGPSTALWTHSSANQVLSGFELSNKDKTHRLVKPIIIENNVYIGGNCTIYPGIKIGHHSVVAPNSAVTKNVEPYTVVGGVPAAHIKSIVNE